MMTLAVFDDDTAAGFALRDNAANTRECQAAAGKAEAAAELI
jgi:hypothetical protein